MGVAEKFSTFCSNLAISPDKRSTISSRYKAITKRLNKDFWDKDSDTMFSRYVGSYGRGTAIHTFSDVDMVFVLPNTVYTQYSQYIYNGPSQLLQAVRQSISITYPDTSIGADGIIVKVDFSDGISFEVVPVFEVPSGLRHPVASDGGSWKIFDPLSEIAAISSLDDKVNGNLKRLCKMARSYINWKSVPMGGLLTDTLAYNFIKDYSNRTNLRLYYDYFTRDFLNYLAGQSSTQNYWLAPGSNQYVYRGGNFEYKSKQCYNIALDAIKHEVAGEEWSANQKWREMYGYSFPA